jgi:hypothetical protein
MFQETAELCRQATRINQSIEFRRGNIIHLPDTGRLIVTGDLHGHRRNFEKTVSFSDLENNPDTHIVFQEILHGGAEDEFGGCLSFKLFFDILRMQICFPKQVHLIMGNHDTAIITDSDVMKGGREMNRPFYKAMKHCFAEDYEPVKAALKEYLLSEPLAVKTSQKIWVSHSLPANRFADDFDTSVFEIQLQPADLKRPKAAYTLTWGRNHSEETLAKLANKLDVRTFVLGHQPAETGFRLVSDNTIILSTEHNHGCLLPLDLAKSYTAKELASAIIPAASVAE